MNVYKKALTPILDTIDLDYEKTFDKVDHRLLVAKMKIHNFLPELTKWVESFLFDRSQIMLVNGRILASELQQLNGHGKTI